MSTILENQLTIEEIKAEGFHKIVRVRETSSGLDAIIAIHDLRMRKTALGGTRIQKYASFEDALDDAKRLAKGMTYKSVACQAAWGGGKSVIMLPESGKTEDILAAFGVAVNQLGGEYICAEDVGCGPEDVAVIAKYTPYVVGLISEKSSGNPSPYTAWGVYRSMQAVMNHIHKTDSVAGKTIAIQGLGSVGSRLAEILFWHGAKLIVTDRDEKKGREIAKLYGAKFVNIDEIYDQPCDIFSPCALGGVINPDTIERLRCSAICGAANNQLLLDSDAEELRRVGILYAPDFVANAGGLINVSEETMKEGYNPMSSRNKVDGIYEQMKNIFTIARENGISTQKAVMQLIQYRLKYANRNEQRIYMHHAGMSF